MKNERATYIIILGESEKFADLGSTLGTETFWVDNVGDTRKIGVALLDDGKSQNRKIHCNNAATNRLALTLSSTTRAVAGVAVGKQ